MIIIKGLKAIPKNCYVCPCKISKEHFGSYCGLAEFLDVPGWGHVMYEGRPKCCPLVEIPEDKDE